MIEHPTPEDMANKTERDAAYLDEWRVDQAEQVADSVADPGCSVDWVSAAFAEYRRLVREDVRPA